MSAPIVHDLVLIGGGHSHAIALKQLGMHPIPGVRITVITNVCNTPYSGMLPGYVAGLYSFEDCHIDLRPLAQFAGATMVVDTAIGLDLEHNRVLCAHRPPIAFDWVSIDIGSTPATLSVPGAADHTIPVKPIAQFLQYWDALVNTIHDRLDQPWRLAVIGGGAGGVELALSLQQRLHQVYQSAQQSVTNLEIHLFHQGDRLLPSRHPSISQQVQTLLQQRGVQLHLNQTVCAIESASEQTSVIRCKSGLTVTSDRIFWVTAAAAAPWLKSSGLATDDRGFVLVDETLQSISHPQVFAAGDVATMVNHPRPKAGVFAVRQGKPLVDNLRRVLTEQPLRSFVPQREFLILLGTGDERAIASRGPITLGPAPWIWRWKDRIDRAFMEQFQALQPTMKRSPMPSPVSPSPSTVIPTMRCAGCGSKVGSSVLERVLPRVQDAVGGWNDRSDVLIGLDQPDDAAVMRVPSGSVLVQTVDYFRALVNDPFLLGQITTQHCLSDLFAMGAEPQSALAIATLPYASESKQEETLFQLLAGAVQVLKQAGAMLVGGHTTESAELAFGLTCNGLAQDDQVLRKQGLQPGQVLILTKPLGTGTLFAADTQLKAKGRWIEGAIASMLQSNQAAAQVFRHHHVTACTDVTGFGLLGHLIELVRLAPVSVELDLSALPLLDGASDTLTQGIFSSLHPANARAASWIENWGAIAHHAHSTILFDPQTSGGLLAAIPEAEAIACLTALQEKGYKHSTIIGRVLPAQASEQPVRMRVGS